MTVPFGNLCLGTFLGAMAVCASRVVVIPRWGKPYLAL